MAKGRLYKDAEDNYFFAPKDKQHESFAKVKKVFVEYITYDKGHITPVMQEGKKKVGLKGIEKLTAIGFID